MNPRLRPFLLYSTFDIVINRKELGKTVLGRLDSQSGVWRVRQTLNTLEQLPFQEGQWRFMASLGGSFIQTFSKL
ncbi:unnamed protein product [Orchesella dallaii]|uniref:Uncharacterized protein n=1 Tax=Orchesella dallaii TaxID=48710 RepID=A0ABP1REC5_9HEXA